MKTLLQIRASIFSDGGQSSRLAERFVSQWRALNHRGEVITRDLARDPVPHLTAERFQAFLAKPGERTLPQEADVAYSDALIGELERADVIVIGLPMYNFGVPSALKAYFDHIARGGRTFRYTEKGPVGLLTGKKAIVFATRGEVGVHVPGDPHRDRLRRQQMTEPHGEPHRRDCDEHEPAEHEHVGEVERDVTGNERVLDHAAVRHRRDEVAEQTAGQHSDGERELSRRQTHRERGDDEEGHRDHHPRVRAVMRTEAVGRHRGLHEEISPGERPTDDEQDPQARSHR